MTPKEFKVDAPTMAAYTMPLTTQQEQFSLAYVHSITSAAGYGLEEIRVDVDSVDLTIVQYGEGESYPQIEGLRVQLKCTYAHPPSADGLHFPLKAKNYDDLRRECMNPRILVVLYVPNDVSRWLIHEKDSLSLYHSAYWLSLRGRPRRDTETVTVILKDAFTVGSLQAIMQAIAKGIRP